MQIDRALTSLDSAAYTTAADAMQTAMETKVAPLAEKDKEDVRDQLAKATVHLALVTVTTRAKDAELVVDTKPPVSFFAYPGKRSYLVPDGCEDNVRGAARSCPGACIFLAEEG